MTDTKQNTGDTQPEEKNAKKAKAKIMVTVVRKYFPAHLAEAPVQFADVGETIELPVDEAEIAIDNGVVVLRKGA